MAGACPRCGFGQVDGGQCPRCGAIAAFHREPVRPRAGFPPAGRGARTPRPAEADAPPAGFWIRGLALLLDALFLIALGAVQRELIRLVLGETAQDLAVVRAANRAFEIIFAALYTILFHWLWGQTFGKMMVHIRVVMVDGGPLPLRIAALRYLGSILSAAFFGVGYIMAGLRADRRALHDLIAGTRVEHLDRGLAELDRGAPPASRGPCVTS